MSEKREDNKKNEKNNAAEDSNDSSDFSDSEEIVTNAHYDIVLYMNFNNSVAQSIYDGITALLKKYGHNYTTFDVSVCKDEYVKKIQEDIKTDKSDFPFMFHSGEFFKFGKKEDVVELLERFKSEGKHKNHYDEPIKFYVSQVF